jgi:hypothetical protein
MRHNVWYVFEGKCEDVFWWWREGGGRELERAWRGAGWVR